MDKRKMLANKLRQQPPQRPNVVIGLDGFVDEIIHVVDKRLDAQTFVRLDNIADFARRIDRASGLSTNIELYPTQRKIGGNGPIMCNALAQHEGNYTYIGSLGMPAIDGVFQELAACPEMLVHRAAVVVHGVGRTMNSRSRQSKPVQPGQPCPGGDACAFRLGGCTP